MSISNLGMASYCVEGVVELDVLDIEAFDCFKLIFILPDTAQGNAEAVVEVRISDCDVCAVGFERDAVVSVVYRPVVELDMR